MTENDGLINQKSNQIVSDIIKSENLTQIKDLTHLFNINQCKKQALRVSKYNQLLDKISNNIEKRLQKKPDEFSNSDLIDYFKTLETSVEKSNKSMNTIDQAPAIKQTTPTNQVNINIIDTVDRESKQKIADAIKAILQKSLVETNNNQENDNDSVQTTE